MSDKVRKQLPELTPAEIAEMDTRWHERLRFQIRRGELLYDAGCYEFYNESSGAALPADEQQLLKAWHEQDVIQVTNTYSCRKCGVSLINSEGLL